MRARQLRHQVKVALGLVPLPTRTALNAVVHGKQVLGDYSVEKVVFESMPGFYVTGSLYRPTRFTGKLPGVLCPHGHWANGRFYDAGSENAQQQIEQGAESDVEAARNPIQARCVHLARMGCVVFQYDMIGYADSVQVSYELAHRFAKQRASYNQSENWGLFSPQAERHLQSVVGLQTWNSVRSLDFLETLAEVDSSRLAVTGASGGGTQTFLLAAIDERVKVSFPAVMVSTAMQGGCTCENCSLLRVTTGNVELAGLFAPKPMGVTAANDWTKEMRAKGFPELKQLYALYGAADQVMLVDRTEFGHNYNKVSRTAMYQWFKKHLKLPGSTQERSYRRLTKSELTVWDEKHPRPKPDQDFERRLLSWWKQDVDRQLKTLVSVPAAGKKFYQDAFQAVFQRASPQATDVEFKATNKTDRGDYFVIGGVVRNKAYAEVLPVLFVHPKQWNGEVLLVTTDLGKGDLFKNPVEPKPWVLALVKNGFSVVAPDLIYQGEFLEGSKSPIPRKVENPREAAAYTFGFNHTVFAQRTHDLLNLLVMMNHHDPQPKKITLMGLGQTGSIGAAAAVLHNPPINRLFMSPASRSALEVNDVFDPYFFPGSGRFHGLAGMGMASGVEPIVLDGDELAAPEKLVELLLK
ncbi:MAG: acetylxylan esterase [Planctomycetota bacterium]|nr:acetylxylan esterase [Planctomycetota bacterium]